MAGLGYRLRTGFVLIRTNTDGLRAIPSVKVRGSADGAWPTFNWRGSIDNPSLDIYSSHGIAIESVGNRACKGA